ncbi:trehalose-phosphatase [Desulfobacter hydrogenophilus]|uniref:trehalose-phosphatase n=1 Tax=Desulfobacter hydrogenophilus TaxID=2291 RepID=UPI0013D6FD72|nr:trehalose-phosphatase [Desulfobacter hydrogenophilus]NDY70617.1 hypothetical protein [Desulfobacter hydrogenophilus]
MHNRQKKNVSLFYVKNSSNRYQAKSTLTPIFNDPDKAFLDENIRQTLEKVAGKWVVAVISGRDLVRAYHNATRTVNGLARKKSLTPVKINKSRWTLRRYR